MMKDQIKQDSYQILQDWIVSCTRSGKVSRNTIAVGVVVFHHLGQKCPVAREDVISQGGEVKGARSGLGDIFEQHGAPRRYLKEVTTLAPFSILIVK